MKSRAAASKGPRTAGVDTARVTGPRDDRATPRDLVIITCEHGGNEVPPDYARLFEGLEHLLDSHRGLDFGALTVARRLAQALGAALYVATTTRLLVDLNRSVGHPALHSEATRHLPLPERRRIVDAWWKPHRQAVERAVEEAVQAGHRVIHVASHSFTPELDGEVRRADIGLLYDPVRPGEVRLARLWQHELAHAASVGEAPAGWKIRLNYPYRGRGDGLTSTLRKRYPSDRYVGMELELNQRHVFAGGAGLARIEEAIVSSLQRALVSFSREPAHR